MTGLDTLAAQILEGGVATDETINPAWRECLDDFRRAVAAEGGVTPNAVSALGYGAADLPEGVTNEGTRDWRRAWRAARKSDVAGLDRAEAEHAGALAMLRRHGLAAEYLDTTDRLRWGSNMALARHFYYSRRLKAVRAEPGRILEIGAGSGQFATFATDAGLVSHYVIVDLPEMLLNSAATVARKLPQADIRAGEAPDFSAPGLHFWLLRPSEIALIPDRSLDAGLNFNSFMEMDDQVRDAYIGHIYRTCSPGAAFYNVNRYQQSMARRDGSTFTGNPLLYPYRADDEVIEWGVDEMQHTLRARVFHTPKSFSISRIALIR